MVYGSNEFKNKMKTKRPAFQDYVKKTRAFVKEANRKKNEGKKHV